MENRLRLNGEMISIKPLELDRLKLWTRDKNMSAALCHFRNLARAAGCQILRKNYILFVKIGTVVLKKCIQKHHNMHNITNEIHFRKCSFYMSICTEYA